MKETEPKVYVVGAVEIKPGMRDYLRDIGIPDWTTDAATSGDFLTESAGRLCYRSWQPYDPALPDATNPNVERVREGNLAYIRNILAQGHGSVFEHMYINVIFRDVSRVFTHELVRHRAGWAYSQESLRFVRLSQLKFWVPGSLRESGDDNVEWFLRMVEQLESVQSQFQVRIGLESEKKFSIKKKLTSLMRRLAPMGLATTIMATGNVRAWRHVINMRSAQGAEEEMQFVFDQLVPKLIEVAPACFQDVSRNDDGTWSVEVSKV